MRAPKYVLAQRPACVRCSMCICEDPSRKNGRICARSCTSATTTSTYIYLAPDIHIWERIHWSEFCMRAILNYIASRARVWCRASFRAHTLNLHDCVRPNKRRMFKRKNENIAKKIKEV